MYRDKDIAICNGKLTGIHLSTTIIFKNLDKITIARGIISFIPSCRMES